MNLGGKANKHDNQKLNVLDGGDLKMKPPKVVKLEAKVVTPITFMRIMIKNNKLG